MFHYLTCSSNLLKIVRQAIWRQLVSCPVTHINFIWNLTNLRRYKSKASLFDKWSSYHLPPELIARKAEKVNPKRSTAYYLTTGKVIHICHASTKGSPTEKNTGSIRALPK